MTLVLETTCTQHVKTREVVETRHCKGSVFPPLCLPCGYSKRHRGSRSRIRAMKKTTTTVPVSIIHFVWLAIRLKALRLTGKMPERQWNQLLVLGN
jgi:hypothetical protein